ncbi:hypothetical protein PsYK624_168480 [Phanerochaete sordida]|uniref:Uncharacterized protein n=1 Tax=Phanerochaete sordida TaxID=48140 RepID=A0A9P3LNM9_9APHY|nr:hypothetical protein PsYK624_168480 [Phanerochaete sordida]
MVFTVDQIQLNNPSATIDHTFLINALNEVQLDERVQLNGQLKTWIQESIYRGITENTSALLTGVTDFFKALLDEINPRMDNIAQAINTINANMSDPQVVDDLGVSVGSIVTDIDNIRAAVTNVQRQLNRLPADVGSIGGGSFRPKVSQPPVFSGEKNTIKLDDWRNLVELWNKSQGIVTDNQRIVNALSLVREPANKRLQSYFKKNAADEDLGSIADFWKALEGTYGQLDSAGTASKDLEKLLDNKTLAQKDLVAFSVQFKVLLDNSDKPFSDKYMIDKLHGLLEETFRMFILGKGKANWPKTASEYVDYLLVAYKEVYPHKAQDHIFSKGNSSGYASAKDPNAMEVDAANANTKKGKGKGKQANSQEAKPAVTVPCAICVGNGKTARAKTHVLNDCFELKKNDNKASTSGTGSNNGKAGKPAGGNGKNKQALAAKKNSIQQVKARLAQLEKEEEELKNGDDEDVVINAARITEWDEEDNKTSKETPAQEPADELAAARERLNKKFGKVSARKVDFVSDL